MPRNTFGRNDNGKSLSGNAYVPITHRPDRMRGKLMIAAPDKCDHVSTVCSAQLPADMGSCTCADSWEQDHWVMYWRTNGGRKLATELGIDAESKKAAMISKGMAP